jgi:hypothetical protein
MVKSFQTKYRIFNHLYRAHNPVIRYPAPLIGSLKEYPVDLYQEIDYKTQYGKT